MNNQAVQDFIASQAFTREFSLTPEDDWQVATDSDEPNALPVALDVTMAQMHYAGISAFRLISAECFGSTEFARPSVKRIARSAATGRWRTARNNPIKIAERGNATPINILGARTAFEIASELLFARRGILTPNQFIALCRQIRSLLTDESGNAIQSVISQTSLDGLIGFLSRHRPDSHPNVALTRDGRFSASWLFGKRAKITLVFDRVGGEWTGVNLDAQPVIRGSGAFVVNSLSGIAKPFRSWIKA